MDGRGREREVYLWGGASSNIRRGAAAIIRSSFPLGDVEPMSLRQSVVMTMALCAASASADEFLLAGNRVVRGDVLKESEGLVYVDLGFTVLRIPEERILSRSADEGGPTDSEVKTDLYSQAELEVLPIDVAVERFGEAVVVVKVPSALGSGFVISEDGYVITNSHVVQGELDVTVTVFKANESTFEKKVYRDVEIVAVNPHVDLALLKVSDEELGDTKLTKVFLGDIDELEVGDPTFAVGAPLGLERSVSQGIVSTKNRSNDGRVYVQTTAAINPGNSGGPLFNSKGEVVGVNTWGYLYSEGLGFSVPVDYVKHFIRNRDAFAFDRDNPNSGYRYLEPPKRGDDPVDS